LLRSWILREGGRVEEALEAATEAVAIEPRHAATCAERARCLSVLGRHEEATTVLDAADPSDDANVKGAMVEIEVRRNPTAATLAIAAQGGNLGARLLAARALLEPAAGRAPDPAAALNALGTENDAGASRGEREVPWGPGGKKVTLFEDPRSMDRLRRHRHVLRGRALLLEGSAAAAREELARAEAIGPLEREIRKLRRDLEAARSGGAR